MARFGGAEKVVLLGPYTALGVAAFPALSSFTTALLCRCGAAHRSGVLSRLSGLSGLTSFRSNSSFTTPSHPYVAAAYESGVRPPLAGLSGLTSSRSNSSFTTPSHPFSAAYESGVWPLLLGLLGLTYFLPNSKPITCRVPRRRPMLPGLTNNELRNSLTTPSCPFSEAHESAV